MQRVKIAFTLVIILWVSALSAQVVDNTASFNTIHSNSYFRLSYDNDYFTKMDYYYSQGISLEYVHPAIKKFLLTRILIKLPQSDIKYGLAIDHFVYTPTSIRSNSILYGDRPYAADITFKTFSISTNAINRTRLSTSLIIGIIGPAAFGREMQTGIHKWLKNILPLGWQYQIKNDLILNYQTTYEKELLTLNNCFQLSSSAEARLGTLNDKLSGGLSLMAGHFNDPYNPGTNNKNASPGKWQYYFYGHPQVSLVGYDATMQGGLFNRKSPYTIAASDISRFTFQADAGLVVSTGKVYLSYCQSILTKEFRTGQYHRWGGIRIGLIF